MYRIHSGLGVSAVAKYKDVKSAYRYLLDAIFTGVTYFDEIK